MSNAYGWISLSKESPLRYRKEILPIEAGWEKDGEELPLTSEFADKMISETNRMIGNSVKSPVVLSHEGNEPFGQNIRLERGDNGRGTESVFSVIDFNDEASRDRAMTNDVSVFVPPVRMDGKGNSYVRAMEHLALTPYPVVHGLDKWQPLAASFKQGTKSMDLSPLLTALGVKKGDDDKATMSALVGAIKELKTTKKKVAVRASLKDPEPVKIPALMLSSVKAGRATVLKQLVSDGRISPATNDKLAAKYCSDEYLTLSLSKDVSDDFDFVVEQFGANTVLELSGKSAGDEIGEAIKLAMHPNGPDGKDKSPMQRAVEAYAVK